MKKLISTIHHPVRKTVKYPPGTDVEGMKKRARSYSKNRES
jgi:hypothetical protein